jgi:hypothetical protein
MRVLSILCCLAALPLLLGAEFYQWVDDDGVVTYSQQAPRDRESQRVRIGAAGSQTSPSRSADPADPAAPAELPAELDPTPARQPSSPEAEHQAQLERLQAAEEARQKEIAAIRQTNCERARTVLERLQSAPLIRVQDEQGRDRLLDDDELQARIAEAQKAVAENCSPRG